MVYFYIMQKSEARKKYLSQRKSISQEAHSLKSLAIANAVLSMDVWKSNVFHVFLPIEKLMEVNTFPLINLLRARDKAVVVPRVVGTLNATESLPRMEHLLYDSAKTSTGASGICEPLGTDIIDPQIIDVVFLPLLAFDVNGNRVGYGKGFYDVFLKECRPDVIKIGLSFFEAEEIIESNANDVAMDFCATPTKIHTFKN